MRSRRPSHRLPKIHRSYTVNEVAELFGVHRNTVREWLRRGLATCDDRRPTLILGHELAAFLERRHQGNKRPCAPGQLYCVRCRSPQFAAGGMADCVPVTAISGNLVGICPVCSALMNRRVSLARLDEVRGGLDVGWPKGREHIDESPKPRANRDFKQE